MMQRVVMLEMSFGAWWGRRESESDRGREKETDTEIWKYFSCAIRYSRGEKNPSELEVAAMDRELVEKFIEVTGKCYIVCALARELSFRLNNTIAVS